MSSGSGCPSIEHLQAWNASAKRLHASQGTTVRSKRLRRYCLVPILSRYPTSVAPDIMKKAGTGQYRNVSMKLALSHDLPCAGPAQKQPLQCRATTPSAAATPSTSMYAK